MHICGHNLITLLSLSTASMMPYGSYRNYGTYGEFTTYITFKLKPRTTPLVRKVMEVELKSIIMSKISVLYFRSAMPNGIIRTSHKKSINF